MQQGRSAARAIQAELRSKPREARRAASPARPGLAGASAGTSRSRGVFSYTDRGQMATIGRSRAICEAGRLRFGGFAAWLFWLTVHIYFLVGFKNRLFVVIQWAWAYLSYSRGARLIVSREWRSAGHGGFSG
jgi:NADH dehydrogenase